MTTNIDRTPIDVLQERLDAALKAGDETEILQLEDALRDAQTRLKLPAELHLRRAIVAYDAVHGGAFEEVVAPRLAGLFAEHAGDDAARLIAWCLELELL